MLSPWLNRPHEAGRLSWCAAAALLALLAAPAARAQVYTVNTTADSGAGSLRAAIDTVNANSTYTSIVFSLPANSTISLTSSFNRSKNHRLLFP